MKDVHFVCNIRSETIFIELGNYHNLKGAQSLHVTIRQNATSMNSQSERALSPNHYFLESISGLQSADLSGYSEQQIQLPCSENSDNGRRTEPAKYTLLSYTLFFRINFSRVFRNKERSNHVGLLARY